MRHIDNWDDIQEANGYNDPAPGAYIARIVQVEDDETKEYLLIQWDYAEGQYAGSNAGTMARAGFWPTVLYRSYKPTALGFFKAFKTAVEESNPHYTFDDRDPKGLEGKLMGVVLGEEEYLKANGTRGKRLYVAQTRSVDAIRRGDFTVPALKRMDTDVPVSPSPSQFTDTDDDGELPF